MLDDAYHFLRFRGLIADHCTVEKPPQIYGDDNHHVVSSQFHRPNSQVMDNVNVFQRSMTSHMASPIAVTSMQPPFGMVYKWRGWDRLPDGCLAVILVETIVGQCP